MIDRGHALPVSQQVRLVGIARSSAYYQARPVSEVDQRLMRRIDELHLEFPFAGARMLARLLRREGHEVGRRPAVSASRMASPLNSFVYCLFGTDFSDMQSSVQTGN